MATVEERALHESGGHSGVAVAQLSHQFLLAAGPRRHGTTKCLSDFAEYLILRDRERPRDRRMLGREMSPDIASQTSTGNRDLGCQRHKGFPDDLARGGRDRDSEHPDALPRSRKPTTESYHHPAALCQ